MGLRLSACNTEFHREEDIDNPLYVNDAKHYHPWKTMLILNRLEPFVVKRFNNNYYDKFQQY